MDDSVDKIVLQQEAANLLWKTEGLNTLVTAEEREILGLYQLVIGLDKPYKPSQSSSFYKEACSFMNQLCEKYSYDSGIKKFDHAKN